jgi:hypothetical protein
VLESFVKAYENRSYRFPTLVTHAGTVFAFAMDGDRRIRYATLALSPDTPLDVDGWPADPQPVPFPRELTPVGFAYTDPTVLPEVPRGGAAPVRGATTTVDDPDPFLSTTARLGAAAPFTAVSDGQYLYLFRQSIVRPTPVQIEDARHTLDTSADPAARAAAQEVLTDAAAMVPTTDPGGAVVTDADGVPVPLVSGHLLVDRFLLVGGRLEAKMEVRFQRSRNRTRPATRTDGLGAKDLDGHPFVEPTQELRFLPPADRGRFAVTLAPTSVAGGFRWQLFCADEAGGVVWSYSVEQGADGLFDTAGRQAFTCTDHPDVYSPAPGTCPRAVTADGASAVCGKTLVVAVERSGAGGTALRLGGGAAVRLHGTQALGSEFTIEAWLRGERATGEQVLLSGGADDAHSCPTVRIVDGSTVRAGFGDGTTLRTVTTGSVLVPGAWQHVAVSYDGSLMTICIDGAPVLTSTDLAGSTPVGTAPEWIGATSNGFTGVVDELRMWSRARPVREIRDQQHLRQSGRVAGRAGYWRFDAGRGPTVWDQAGPATGEVDGAVWTTSDAPIGMSRGLSRTAVRINGRVPTGGVSTTVYYQQENAVGGYAGQPKRHKGAARVMLTAVTSPAGASGDPDAGRVTALDFGLGTDGRLSDLPTAVDLPVISGPTAAGESLGTLLDRIGDEESAAASLGSAITSTQQLIADLTTGLEKGRRAMRGNLSRFETITGACADLNGPATTVNQLLGVLALLEASPNPDPASVLRVQQQLQGPLVQLSNGVNAHQVQLDQAVAQLPVLQRDLAASQARLAALRKLVDGDLAAPVQLLHVDADGGTVAGAVLGFAPARSAPQLFDSALGSLGVYFRGDGDRLSAAYYDTFTGRARFAVPGGTSPVVFVPYSALPEFTDLVVTVSPGADDDHCDLIVSLPHRSAQATAGAVGGEPITETWRALPRDPDAFAAILAGTAQPPGQRTPYDYAAHATTNLPGAVPAKGSRLVAADARAAAGPVALGAAVLQNTPPSAQWYGSLPGTTLVFDGAATIAGLLDTTAVRLDGIGTGIALGNPGQLDITGQITIEAWIRPTAVDGVRDVVARGYTHQPEAEVFLRIVDGSYQVGSWNGTEHLVKVPIPAGDPTTWVHLAGTHDGVRWQLYRNGTLVGQVEDPTGAVPVTAGWTVGTSAAGDRRFAGDIDDVRIWSGARTAVEIADSMGQRLGGTEKQLAGYWFVAGAVFRDHTTGHADGTYQGAPGWVASPPMLTRGQFDVTGDVTVEAWVNPEPGSDVDRSPIARIVQHRSESASYVLALRKVPSALSFDGTGQLVTVQGSAGLDLTGSISVEAWVQPTASDDFRYVLARGLDAGHTAEVALRIFGDRYQFGVYAGGQDHFAVGTDVPVSADLNRWVHLAGVHDGTSWRLYRNGAQIAVAPDPTGAVPVDAPWTIGGSADRSRFFRGAIGEVRIWARPLSPQEVADAARAPRWATGTEPDLALAVHHDGQGLVDVGPGRHGLTVVGSPSAVDGLGGAYRAAAGSGGQYVESVASFPGHDWTHLAMSFDQEYAVRLAAGGYLDAGTKSSLDITGELTLEVTVQLDDLSAPHGLLTCGRLGSAASDRVPYALSAETNGSLVFSFVDVDGFLRTVATGPAAVVAGQLHRIGVIRRLSSQPDSNKPPGIDRWTDISFIVDGSFTAKETYRGSDPAASTGALLLGRTFRPDGSVLGLRGSLSELRLWRKALQWDAIGARIKGDETGLVAWWRFAEGTGTVVADARGGSPAAMHGAVRWDKTPDPSGTALLLYLDGVPVATKPAPAVDFAPTATGFALGRDGTTQTKDLFTGQLEELRIWRARRSTEQLQDNLFRRIEGEQQDLVAYYTFDGEPGERLTDQGPRGNTVQAVAGDYQPSTAPVGADAPQVRNAVAGITNPYTARTAGAPGIAEYADLQRAADGSAIGVYKRCYGYVDAAGRWLLVTGFKVGDLTVEWVGQAQFDPQLAGFIEGAPPVPSENLTAAQGYDGASGVTIKQAATTKYTYASSRKAGLDVSAEATVKTSAKTMTLAGAAEGVLAIEAPLGVGFGEAALFVELEEVESSDIGGSITVSTETSTSWLASTEGGQGQTRTTASALALTCLQETPATQEHRDLGLRWIPQNVGMALVQSETADVFALRLRTTGALVAYQMRPNPDIPKDWNVLVFPMDPRYTKAGVLDGKVGLEADTDYPAGLSPSSDASFYKPIEAYQLKARIEREEQELATYFRQFQAGPGGLTADVTSTLPPGTKRNLANTYVWTAAGGSFAETRTVMDSRSETTGGSFSFTFSLGGSFSTDFSLFGASFDLDISAKVGAHLELEVSKKSEQDTDFGVDVDVHPERDISTVDAQGKRILQPGKVDAYRFTSFYLAPDTDHHDLFFNQVVDPIWLAQSTDPAAAALRGARQPGQQPPCWRVLHRVTFVSRILAPISPQADPYTRAMRALDLNSNYELVRTLEPYVACHTGTYGEFVAAVRTALTRRLPDLLGHVDQVTDYLVQYFGVDGAPR